VTSNVARDMLQTASEFGSVPKMVVEYVSNGLDNPNDSTQPVTVKVNVRRYGGTKTLTISDNGCGMDATGLAEFFVMHRENAQRQRGRRARGRFGTGKSAGFGVGTSVLIDTVREGRHWKVELTADELRVAAAANRPPKPTRLIDGQPITAANGTTITVSGIRRQAKPESIRNELRRRLGRQLESHRVYVGGERVRLIEPGAAQTWTFRSSDDPAAAGALGPDLTCTVHAVASGDSVEEAIRGVVVTSHEVPVGQYQAAGDLANRIYGLCEVPALDDDTSTPSPFTDRRDLTLNLDNILAAAVEGWVRRCLDLAVRELHSQERDRLRRARDAQLQQAASRAESVLNQHYRTEFRIIGGAGSEGPSLKGSPSGALNADEDGSAVLPSHDGVAGYQPDHREPRDDGETALDDDGARPPDRDEAPESTPGKPRPRDPLAQGRGEPVSHLDEARRVRRSRGGFHIDYSNAGAGAPRAAFYESELTIVINLDHPLLAAVPTGSELFRGLAFTIAAEEYAQATANQLLEKGTLEDAYEALNYERVTMDTLSRAFAEVFTTLADSFAVAER
jgi:hypothetical protein